MNTIEELFKHREEIETKLGYKFKTPYLMALSFVHRSYINEHRDMIEHNERLEFLGDSVLGLLVSEYLFKTYPEATEGDLSHLRSRLVEADICVEYVEELKIGDFLLLGKGERMSQGRGRISILADLFEAIVGAIFLDGGIESAKEFVIRRFSKRMQEKVMAPKQNWKANLQEICQKTHNISPTYHVLNESGPEHEKTFEIAVMLGENPLGKGIGPSKKEAQQAAAKDALSKLSDGKK